MKPIYLLDTNIYSELAKPKPNEELVQKVIQNQKISAIPVVAWSESLYGVKRLPNGSRKERLEETGSPMPDSDLKIASMAIANGMILVTRNTKDSSAF